MIKIAICDDDYNWSRKLKRMIEDWSWDEDSDVNISIYTGGTSLIAAMEKKETKADIIFLDINMDNSDDRLMTEGFKIAAQIKRTVPDTLIIFNSAHAEFVYESFEYQPFRYIRKEFADPEVYIALKAAVNVLKHTKHIMADINTIDNSFSVPTSNITYVEVADRRCTVNMVNGETYSIRKSLKEFMNQIKDDKLFIMLHSGCAVNMRHVRKFNDYSVTLNDDTELIFSRANRRFVKDSLFYYWREKS